MALLRQARTTALPIRQCALIHLAPHQEQAVNTPSLLDPLPLLWVNADTRPNVGDLWRVYAVEGGGEIVTRWLYDLFEAHHHPTFFLMCTVTTPVKTTFFLSFPLPHSEETLHTIATASHLAVLTSPPPAILPLRCSGEELAHLLRHGFILECSHWELPSFLTHWRTIRAEFLQ